MRDAEVARVALEAARLGALRNRFRPLHGDELEEVLIHAGGAPGVHPGTVDKVLTDLVRAGRLVQVVWDPTASMKFFRRGSSGTSDAEDARAKSIRQIERLADDFEGLIWLRRRRMRGWVFRLPEPDEQVVPHPAVLDTPETRAHWLG